MIKLGLIDLEILHLGIKCHGVFNERDIENSNLKRLGVGRILDSLASLKDRKLLELNTNGEFLITDLAKHSIWDEKIPLWARILKILEIKSFSNEEISSFLLKSEKEIFDEIENLRKNNLVLMSPQRVESKIIRVFEILPEGIEKLKEIEKDGFRKENLIPNPVVEILSIINQMVKEINDSDMKKEKKEQVISRLSLIKDKMAYFE